MHNPALLSSNNLHYHHYTYLLVKRRILYYKYLVCNNNNSIGSCRISDSISTVHMTPSESAKCKVVALLITMGSQFTGSHDVQTTMKVQNAEMKAWQNLAIVHSTFFQVLTMHFSCDFFYVWSNLHIIFLFFSFVQKQITVLKVRDEII